MAEDKDKKKEASEEHPDGIEKVIDKLQDDLEHMKDSGKEALKVSTPGGSEVSANAPVLKVEPDEIAASCQWFLVDNNICDKVKKNMKCKGDVNICPLCK
jgi:hypothetical protein